MHQWKGLHEYYSMETQKYVVVFQKKLKLYFDFYQRAEIVQVGLNMNLHDIGDASSSLRGSTSSLNQFTKELF